MKKLIIILLSILVSGDLLAQKIDYKSGLLQVDGKDLAKVVKIKDKENFGLTSTFELQSMSGETLIIARVATNFVSNRNDNSGFYYQFTFLPVDKVGVFSLSKLGAEKSFAKLIGQSGIVVDDKLDSRKVSEMLARKSENPEVAIEYHLVKRARIGPPNVKDNQIYQTDVLIGKFKDISSNKEFDTYEFSLPDGLVIATVSFAGGNGAKNCNMSTNKDKQTRNAVLKSDGTYGAFKFRTEGVDRNAVALKHIATWLIDGGYL
ncbi:hypothetical protein [Pedobacter nyackensis]|uniref:Uncharacterized protein n=1 Tax=Pedobacter nyackensis TaxID=475255 RepID=A0A1W2A1D0_9SPHI|nr:hypothetical protein [Pedobacter nyackensis]SMC54231.1 hypothetical protein SAMN04488101_101229 [Pedobacter nyackensis]